VVQNETREPCDIQQLDPISAISRISDELNHRRRALESGELDRIAQER